MLCLIDPLTGSQVRCSHRGRSGGVQAAGLRVHPAARRASWRSLGSRRQHCQSQGHGDVSRLLVDGSGCDRGCDLVVERGVERHPLLSQVSPLILAREVHLLTNKLEQFFRLKGVDEASIDVESKQCFVGFSYEGEGKIGVGMVHRETMYFRSSI